MKYKCNPPIHNKGCNHKFAGIEVPAIPKPLNIFDRIEKIEAWIDKWEGIGEKPYDSGWTKYRKAKQLTND